MITKVQCKFCYQDTDMIGTKTCDNCWEVTHRLRHMPLPVIRRILESLENLRFLVAEIEEHNI